jgi:hypothetical protein
MSPAVYRYTFAPEIASDDIESTLLLALLAVESLHGEADTRLDAAHAFDPARRTCVVDADSTVGRDLCRLFVGFMRREFGDSGFQVERINRESKERVPEPARTA